MPAIISTVTDQDLKAVTLPSHGGRYATVGHGYIIDKVREELVNNNFTIKEEVYKSNINGEVAQGIIYLNHGDDPEIGLMFAWGNSYDKSMKFKCAMGAHVFICGNGIISGDMSNYGRKHLGDDAKAEVTEHIQQHIKSAGKYFKQLVADKEVMKQVDLSSDQIAMLLGKLYFSEDILTSGQMIAIKDQMKKPSYDYNTGPDNLWTIYNHVTYALKKAHPKHWMDAQRDLHTIVKSMFFHTVTPTDPNQITIDDVISNENNYDVVEDTKPQVLPEELEKVTVIPEELEKVTVIPEETAEIEDFSLSLDDHIEVEPEIKDEVEIETDFHVEPEVEPEVETDDTGLMFIDEMEESIDEEPAVEEALEEEVTLSDTEEEKEVEAITYEKLEEELANEEEVNFEETDKAKNDSSESQLELPDFEF